MGSRLNEDEQQTLAFARAVLHAPPWILIDEVFDALDDDALGRVADVLGKDLLRTRSHPYRPGPMAAISCFPRIAPDQGSRGASARNPPLAGEAKRMRNEHG